MGFRLSNDVVQSAPEEEFDDLNGLRDTLFVVIQRAAQLGMFNDCFSCSSVRSALIPVLNRAKQKDIVDGALVDCLPNVYDDDIVIRIIMHKGNNHYRMGILARDEITDYDFEHKPLNSFSTPATL